MVSEDRLREELAAAMEPHFIDGVKKLKKELDDVKEQAKQVAPVKKPAQKTRWSE